MQRTEWCKALLKGLVKETKPLSTSKQDHKERVVFALRAAIVGFKNARQYELAMWSTHLLSVVCSSTSLYQAGEKLVELGVKEAKQAELTPASNTGVTDTGGAAVPIEYFTRGR